MVLLWENPAPSSGFSSQTVLTADEIAGFDWFLIELKNYYTENVLQETIVNRTQPMYATVYGLATFSGTGGANVAFRLVTINSSGLKIGSGYSKLFNSTAAASASNNVAIPIRVYGINF